MPLSDLASIGSLVGVMRGTFDEGFQDFMDGLMREIPPEPASNFGAAFKSLSAAELSGVKA